MDYILVALLVLVLVLLAMLLLKKPKKDDTAQQLLQKLEVLDRSLQQSRGETGGAIANVAKNVNDMVKQNYEQQITLNETIAKKLEKIHQANYDQATRQTTALDNAMKAMQQSNEKKLDEMRQTVDEKLQKTLNTRIDSSFKTVSQQLENVYKSLGEMKELSAGVTDKVTSLNRILSNVKARGTWGEAQLKAILDDIVPNMYEENFATNPKSQARVEFAIKIPAADGGAAVYMPIDSKFPMEDYARLIDAADNGDGEKLLAAKKALKARVKGEAKQVAAYINEPLTTPFAILYLATEGLYAEVVQDDELVSVLRGDLSVMVAGPSTIAALLNSLAVGFKTMAINQKAGDVMKTLAVAKAQYDKFGALLDKASKKIAEAGTELDKARKRNDIIQKKLRSVEVLDEGVAESYFEANGGELNNTFEDERE